MTISTNPTRNSYIATAGQTIFPYTFKIFDNTDLNVYITPEGEEPNDSLHIITAYSVDGVEEEDGGNVTLNSGANENDTIVIVSAIPENRTTDFQNNGDFLPNTVNNQFDRVVSLVKQNAEALSRSLLFQESSLESNTQSIPGPEEGKALGWSSGLLSNLSLANVTSEDGSTIFIQYTSSISADTKTPFRFSSVWYDANKRKNSGGIWVLTNAAAGGTPGLDISTGNFYNAIGAEYQIFGELNPFKFGALAAAPEDTLSIQAAINTGRSINFLDGYTYFVVDLVFSGSDVKYFGKSSLKLASAANDNVSTLLSNVTNVTFKGLTFDGNGANQTGVAVEVRNNGMVLGDNISNITWEDCQFINMGIQNTQPDNPNVPSTYAIGSGIQRGGSGLNAINLKVFRCHFENCHAGIAPRGSGENLTVDLCTFKHLRLNSVRTNDTSFKNIIITRCEDEDTRGFECWGDGLKFTINKSINSHRHGVSGGIKNAYIAGNEFVHTVTGLDSLYAIEIGLSENSRAIGNEVVGWEGNAAIRLTDSTNGSEACTVSANTVIGGIFSGGAIGSSSSQDNCIYVSNILKDVTGQALVPRGDGLIIKGNIVIDSSPDLLSAKTINCLVISSGSQQIITGNTFNLAGKWVSGTQRTNIIANLSGSVFTGNKVLGGYRGISTGSLEDSVCTGNKFKDIVGVFTSSTSQGGIARNNQYVNVDDIFFSGNFNGFAGQTKKIGERSNTPPTTGTWDRADIVYYVFPVAGGKVGAVCTAAGTPGTWKEFGAIDV